MPRPATPPAATVTLRILRMEAPLGGTLDLVASWQLSPADAPRIAHYRALPADSSIPSYIRALREAVTLLADDDLQSVVVTNLLGQTVSHYPVQGINQLVIDTNPYPSGVYLLKISTKKGTATRRLVVW